MLKPWLLSAKNPLPYTTRLGAGVCAALFDFDGTLSLIRTGWQQVMVPMMVDFLRELKSGEGDREIRSIVEETVWQLTGKDTIYQMEALADLVRQRSGNPWDPLAYKREYLGRLNHAIAARIEGLRSGAVRPDSLLVPGARAFVEALCERGVRLYLASGTDHGDVTEEARLLKIDQYFGDRIFGARDDRSFSKAHLVRQILSTAEFSPEHLIVFGDGYVEIEEVKKAGGRAIGVATCEPECLLINEWKRQRLSAVGADMIVANFLCRDLLLSLC
ncbi:MAG: HAD family hydrolase [Bryobacteraceae bacterium]|jgi:phosphoglycolate phosphatase-like HAD superfamily hydrolase